MNTNLKRIVAGSVAAVMLMGVITVGNFRPDVASAEDLKSDKKIISVSGEAKIKVTPDIAYVNVGVRTEGKTAVIAQQSNAQKMTAVLDALKKSGINANDLKTSNYYVNPMYNYDNNTSKIIGYEATNTLTVKVRNITKTGETIDLAAKMGANISNGVSFGLTDETASYNQALTAAVKNAQGKATAIATAVGIKITAPSKISEDSNGGAVQPMYSNAKMDMRAESSAGATTPVESGEIEVVARVSVEYQY